MTDVYSHPTYLAFINRIREQPEDDQLRLACSDWLEENGEADRSEFIRVQVEKAKMKCEWEGTPVNCQRYGKTCKACDRWRELKAEEERLKGQSNRPGTRSSFVCWNGDMPQELAFAGDAQTGFTYSRGFLEEIRLSAADWIRHGDEIVKRNPVRKVALSGASWYGDGFFYDTNTNASGSAFFNAGGSEIINLTVTALCRWAGIEFTFEPRGIYSRDEMIERTIDQLGEMTNADLSLDLRRYVAGRR